jgi:hypothetical protein
MLENGARVSSGAIAATLDDDALTFGDIETRGNWLAHAMLESGIRRGDRVLWWGDTSLEAVPVFLALAKIGAVFAPLNARASVDELTPVATGLAIARRTPAGEGFAQRIREHCGQGSPRLGSVFLGLREQAFIKATTLDAVGKDFSGFFLSAAVVGTVDNFLRPVLVGRDAKMPDLLILIGTLGGLFLFGLIGFIVGPIVCGLFLTVWDIYGATFREILPPVTSFRSRDQDTSAIVPRESSEH